MSSNESFLARWSRRKHDSRSADDAPAAGARDESKGLAPAPVGVEPAPAACPKPESSTARPVTLPDPDTPADRSEQDAAGTAGTAGRDGRDVRRDARKSAKEALELPPIDSLTPASDFRPFMQAGVDASTRNAALAKLFHDPHFSVTDGLDVYIDDYNETEPIPPALLAGLKQLRTIGLSDDEIERMREGDEAASAALAGPQQAGASQESGAGDGAGIEPPGGQAAQLDIDTPAARLDASAEQLDAPAEQLDAQAPQLDSRTAEADPHAEQADPQAAQRVRKT